MKTLECMEKHYNGAHCGLADWYPEIEKGIQDALVEGVDFTTGWYSSKKEIASARITLNSDILRVEVSVSDDFDTEGCASMDLKFAQDIEIETIQEAIYTTWDMAEQNRKENEPYIMYQILDRNTKGWVETFLIDNSDFGLEEPPGDNYHEWGWQGESELPEKVKRYLEKAMYGGERDISFKKWRALLVG